MNHTSYSHDYSKAIDNPSRHRSNGSSSCCSSFHTKNHSTKKSYVCIFTTGSVDLSISESTDPTGKFRQQRFLLSIFFDVHEKFAWSKVIAKKHYMILDDNNNKITTSLPGQRSFQRLLRWITTTNLFWHKSWIVLWMFLLCHG